jgi:hypothetical protein
MDGKEKRKRETSERVKGKATRDPDGVQCHAAGLGNVQGRIGVIAARLSLFCLQMS